MKLGEFTPLRRRMGWSERRERIRMSQPKWWPQGGRPGHPGAGLGLCRILPTPRALRLSLLDPGSIFKPS